MVRSDWDDIAKYWDLFSEDRTIDKAFWVDCAKRYGSPILEFACGTGRLTSPIAHAGVTVVGIDISRPMIRIAKKKLKNEPKNIRQNITFLTADANNFSIPKIQFSAIFSPWGFPPITQKEQSSLFRSVKNHLKPNGFFIVDEYNFKDPKHDWSSFYIKDYRQIPEKNLTAIRYVQQWTKASTKTNRFLYLWDIIKKDGTLKRVVTERAERMYTRSDLEKMMTDQGFSTIYIYGDYDKCKWSRDSERTIIVTQLKKGKQKFGLWNVLRSSINFT